MSATSRCGSATSPVSAKCCATTSASTVRDHAPTRSCHRSRWRSPVRATPPHDVPVLTGIAFVDRLLGLAGHPAQPVPEVVIDVGGEVCDAVTELCCHSEVFLCSSSAAARARCSPATAA